MNWFTGIFVYLVVWWVVLFAVLPWGVTSQTEAGAVTPGSEPGAPAAPMLLRKGLITTLVAGVIWLALAWGVGSGLVVLNPR